MSYQSVGARIIAVPAIAALALGMSGCGTSKKTAERAGASASASAASQASKKAGTPTTTVVAQNVKGGAFCSIHYQQGKTANGKTLTCKKAKDGKWRWL
jgi:hypothetical protein